MSDAIRTIKDMCEAQSRKARDAYQAEMASYPWSRLTVKYCADQKEWVVWGHNNPDHPAFESRREREVISTERLRKDAIAEAMLYAFSTDQEGAPARAPVVDIYRKDGVWIDSIHKPIAPKPSKRY